MFVLNKINRPSVCCNSIDNQKIMRLRRELETRRINNLRMFHDSLKKMANDEIAFINEQINNIQKEINEKSNSTNVEKTEPEEKN